MQLPLAASESAGYRMCGREITSVHVASVRLSMHAARHVSTVLNKSRDVFGAPPILQTCHIHAPVPLWNNGAARLIPDCQLHCVICAGQRIAGTNAPREVACAL